MVPAETRLQRVASRQIRPIRWRDSDLLRVVNRRNILMRAKARLLGHPIHPMLIVFPLGLLSVAAIFDIIYISTHNGHWADLSYWMIASGVIGGLIAAVFGLIDWLGIPQG